MHESQLSGTANMVSKAGIPPIADCMVRIAHFGALKPVVQTLMSICQPKCRSANWRFGGEPREGCGISARRWWGVVGALQYLACGFNCSWDNNGISLCCVPATPRDAITIGARGGFYMMLQKYESNDAIVESTAESFATAFQLFEVGIYILSMPYPIPADSLTGPHAFQLHPRESCIRDAAVEAAQIHSMQKPSVGKNYPHAAGRGTASHS